MPDDSASKPVEQQAAEHVEPIKAADTNLSPNTPNAQPAQPISNETVESQIVDIQDRVKRGEWWMISLTAAIALFALCSIGVGLLQWNVMKGQLKEMHDGGVDTHNLAVSAGTQAAATQTLADRMKDQAGSTKQMADDSGNLLRGTQAAFVTFSAFANALTKEVTFSARNESGKAQARNVRADLTVTIRRWPDKSIRLGPFHHPIKRERLGDTPGMNTIPALEDPYSIPKVTPEIADELSTGRAYITLQWQASYDNGFGNIIHSLDKQSCDVFMYLGHVKCATGPNSFLDNDIRGETPCAGIDILRKQLEQSMTDNQKQCKKAN